MNGGIYDESYAPLGLYIENGQQKVALNLASGEGNFFIRPGGVFYVEMCIRDRLSALRPFQKGSHGKHL